MCGLAGVVDFLRPIAAWTHHLSAMQSLLQHRGPDGQGGWRSGHCGLVHTRLAIVDPTGAQQPMASWDGRFQLVYNGEIYNHRELAARLDYPFETTSDTEVLLAAWHRWGPACTRYLNGMYAFFIWEPEQERGWLVRDALGVKPALFRRLDHGIAFASEARALNTGRLDPERFAEWAVMPSLSGAVLAGVESVPAGHGLRIDRTGINMVPMAQMTAETELAPAIVAAMSRQAAADVPVGVFVSGGLDSAIVASGAAPCPAWTVQFQDQASFDYTRSLITRSDDTPFARLVARALGLDHRIVDVPRQDLAADLAAISTINDALPAWEQELAQHRLSRAASQHVKVVLVGDAADETHWGYDFLLDDAVCASPEAVLHRFGADRRADFLKRPAAELLATLASTYRTEAEAEDLSWSDVSSGRRALTWLVQRRWLGRLLHNGDVHTMAHGLEARVPFADAELLAAAARVPAERGVVDGVEKAALRAAAPSVIPSAIRWRKKSALPKDQNCGQIYRAEALRLLDGAADFFDPDAISRLAQQETQLGEVERAILFASIAVAHFSAQHLTTSAPFASLPTL